MNAVKKNQLGASLIELLVATTVGLLVIFSVTAVFLKGHTSAANRSLELMLQQDVNDALRLIKEDILRAGYQSGANSTLIISGALDAIAVDGSCVAMAYTQKDGTPYYSSFRLENKKLKLDQSSAVLTLTQMCTRSGALSLLYDKQINVTDFTIENVPIGLSSGIRSQMIKIGLAAELKNDANYHVEKEVAIKVRNWSAG